MKTEIIYRKKLDRAPTMEDRINRLGFEDFVDRLKEKKWIAKDGDTALIPFHMTYKGNEEKGNNYVEWRANINIVN